jgi:hypothetical protein
MRRVWFVVLASIVTACAPLQGPEVDLHAIATPDPHPQAARPSPQPPPGPTPEAGTFRAWVPRMVSHNGDIEEGHWIIVTTTPPVVETVEPATPLPRAPKPHLHAKPPAPAHPQVPVSQGLPVTPVLPTGFPPQGGGPGMVRVPALPSPRLPLGGQ